MLKYLLPLILITFAPVQARDDGQWTNADPEIRAWFPTVMQPPANKASCCGEGDAFDAEVAGTDPTTGDFLVRVINGRGLYPDGLVVHVPSNRLQTAYGNPTGRTILFMSVTGGNPICLIPLPGV